ncbi:hypothetical protein AA313_de0203206 [Arthrobotrys entomopaga]|nr:hypothetical protein AA313_de0203206 [Arthrobotrys entomopaga]
MSDHPFFTNTNPFFFFFFFYFLPFPFVGNERLRGGLTFRLSDSAVIVCTFHVDQHKHRSRFLDLDDFNIRPRVPFCLADEASELASVLNFHRRMGSGNNYLLKQLINPSKCSLWSQTQETRISRRVL